MSTTNSTWPDQGSNPDRRSAKPRLTAWAMARRNITSCLVVQTLTISADHFVGLRCVQSREILRARRETWASPAKLMLLMSSELLLRIAFCINYTEYSYILCFINYRWITHCVVSMKLCMPSLFELLLVVTTQKRICPLCLWFFRCSQLNNTAHRRAKGEGTSSNTWKSTEWISLFFFFDVIWR